MTELESWLQRATRNLSRESAAQVRGEIREHYESACEAAIIGGASAAEAGRLALDALGDAGAANCQYRKVLLTAAEASMLRETRWETRAFCSRPWLKWALLAVPVTALVAATLTGPGPARVLLAAGIAMGVLFTAPFLPIHTAGRGRAFRVVKWSVLTGMLAVAYGPDALHYSWLLFSCLWPLAWAEWTGVSIRRKLRRAEWPKGLYF